MARVIQSEVLAIIDVDSTITDLTPFITIANLLVTEKLSTIHSDDMLKEIERWLAAHFVAIRDPRAKSESIGGISISYGGNMNGEGLRSTLYGQQVLALDFSGTLAKLGMKQASINVIDWTEE